MKLSDLWPRSGPAALTVRQPTPVSVKPPRPPMESPVTFPATLADCEVYDERLCRDVIRLESHIASSESTMSDETWGHRARAKLKHMKRDRQRLMQHMKKLRIEERKADPVWNSYEKTLIRLLSERAPREVMDECVRLAQAEVGERRAAQEARS